MKLLNFLFLLLVIGSSANAQHFLNGSFETNTAGGTNRYNLSNSNFNNYMSDVTSYGSSAEMDIVHSSSSYGTPRTGSYCIGMSGQRDSMSLKLSCPLTAGYSYTLSFYIMRPSSFATSPDTTYVGLSTSATTFGTMIYTAAPTAAISNWELRTVTFTAPNSGQYITISAQSQSSNSWRWLDDFAIAAVSSAPQICTQPVNASICNGNNTSFAVLATGSSLSYQWQVSTNGGGAWSNVSNTGIYSGATTATLNLTTATAAVNNYQYKCIITGNVSPAATTNAVTLTVGTPTFLTHPSNSSISTNANTSFSVSALATSGYQWQESTNSGSNWTNISNSGVYSGATSATLTLTTVPVSMNGYYYRCIITGTCTPEDTSNNATLTVSAGTPPSISVHPTTDTICAGANKSFSITAANTVTYQWQLSTNSGGNWNNIANTGVYSNATTASLTITGATTGMNGYQYRCIATGGTSPAATSNVATLGVRALPTISSTTGATVCAGVTNAKLRAVASSGATVKWYDSATGGSLLHTGDTLTVTSPATTKTYYAGASIAGGSNNLPTSYVSNNSNKGEMFNLVVTNNITLTDMDLNLILGSSGSYELYYKVGTYVGSENNSSAWTLISSRSSVPSLGFDVPSPMGFNLSLNLAGGQTYAFYITATNVAATTGIRYTNNSGYTTIASNSDLAIAGGIGKAYPFSTNYNNRSFNGTIHYTTGSGCTSSVRTGATLTVNPQAVVTVDPNNSSISSGANTSFAITATGATTYQWQVYNGSAWSNLSNTGIYSNATTATLNLTAATTTVNGYQYRCIASNASNCADTSNTATLTITGTAPSISTHPSNAIICPGNTSFTVVASGTSLTYQWQVNDGTGWTALTNTGIYSNVATATLNLTGATTAVNSYQYRCVVTGSVSPATTSNAATLTINAAPAITAQAVDRTICSGANATFAITATGAGLSYQWQLNDGSGWSALANTGIYTGALTNTLTLTAATSAVNTYQYRCIVTGTCSPTATSTARTLTINAAPAVTVQAVDRTICSGANTTFAITATGAGLSYQWQVNDGSGWSALANTGIYTGALTNTLTLTAATSAVNTYQYRCVVTGTCSPTATSTARTLTINTAPAVTGQPANSTIGAGSNTSFTVTATGTTLTYQWQVNDGSGWSTLTNTGIYTGVATATLNLTNVTALYTTYQYRCVVSGACTPAATSNAATLTVNSAPAITGQPVNSAICSGANTSFTVVASNATGYQWQVNDGSGWANVTNTGIYTGAATATLTLTGATNAVNTYQYRCEVTGLTPPNATTNAATLTINAAPAVTAQAVDRTICSGDNTTFAITATGAGLSYQWQVNDGSGWSALANTGIYSGALTNTLTLTAATSAVNTYQYRCVVTGTCSPTATSTPRTLTINAAPAVTVQAVDRTICSGANTTFGITATGAGLSYQWQVNDGSGWSALANTGIYTGALTNTLTLSAATSAVNTYQYRCVVTGTCSPTATSTARTLTINTAPAITIQPVNNTTCDGSNADFSVTATGAGLSYQWEENDGSGWNSLSNTGIYSGVTTATLSLTGVTATANGNSYRCVITGTCTPAVTSNAVTISINSILTISTQPANSNICSGSNTSFSVAASGTGLSYQWQVNNGSGWTNLTNTGIYSNVASATLNLTAATNAVNGYQYRCVLSSTCTAPANSNAATLTINAVPAITTHPTNSAICAGSNTSFTVAATGAGLSYQWEVNDGTGWSTLANTGIYSGATTNTLSLTGATTAEHTYQYRCVVSGTCTPAVTSNAATLNINNSPSITAQPANTNACDGGNATFSITATGAGLSYQWQVNNGSGWTNLANTGIYSGALTSTLTLTAATSTVNTYQYRCIVSGTCAPAVTSNASTLSINSLLTINTQPANSIICSGNNTSFSVNATASGIAYQWQVNNGSGWTNLTNTGIYSDVATATLNITAATTAITGYQYRCILSSTCAAPVNSNAATVTINVAPAITTQPVNSIICSGSNTSFNIVATGAGVTYQWQVDNGSGWTNLTNTSIYTGATTNTLSLTNATSSVNTYQYRCIVGGSCVPGVNSNTVVLTVNDQPAITGQPSNSVICAGNNTSFTTTATGTALMYQWQVNDGTGWTNVTNTGIYSGATAVTLTLTAATVAVNGNQYRCIVSGTCTPSVTSTPVTITVNVAPAITLQPTNSIICEGANTSFSITAAGTGLSYQWEVNNGSGWANLANTGVYNGATTNTLTLTNASAGISTYQYRCTVGGSCVPGVNSTPATITVNTAPAITTPPANNIICSGSNTSFSITATGTALNYQWQVNDGSGWVNLSNTGIYSGTGTATLDLTAATTAINNYQYRCVVNGTCTPAVTSTSATITVNAAPAVTLQPVNRIICENTSTTFTVAATGTGLTYQWEVNDGSGWVNISNTGIYSGAATNTLSLTNATTAVHNYQYRCTIGGTCVPGITSSAVTLTINTAPVITAAPVNSIICEMTNTTFSVTATGTGLNYQWQVNDGSGWVNLTNTGIYSNVATATLSLTSATIVFDNYQYRCIVSGTCIPSATSAAATLIINRAPVVSIPPANSIICTGNNTSFTVTATGTNINYQWQVNDGTGWNALTNTGIYSGTTTPTLSLTAATTAQHTYQYRCVVSGTCTPAATSAAATLTINTAPVVSTQPTNRVICELTNTTFTVAAVGAGLSYQWEVNNGSGWINVINTGIYSGANTNTLTLTAATTAINTYQYRCVVNGTCTPGTISNPATITINTLPVVTSHPVGSIICSGNNTSFTIAATGTNISYQWQVNNGSGWSALTNTGIYSGVTTATLSLTAATTVQHTYQYRCVVSGTCTPAAISTPATLTINTAPLVTTHPANSTICENTNTTFAVVATGAGLTYQWQVNDGSGWTNATNTGIYGGATTATLSLTGASTAQHSYQYRCVVTGTCVPTATSNAATLFIQTAPVVTAQPVNSTICTGNNTSFAVSATGTALIYQWQVSSNGGVAWANITNTGIYSNATTATLNLTAASTIQHNYQYRCIVSGTCAPLAVSAVATLNINVPPAITTQPVNRIICEGSNTTYSIAATGTNITYQWQGSNNGTNWNNLSNTSYFSNVTTATLTLTNANTGAYAMYRCVVSGNCPPVATSAAATLMIETPPLITSNPANTTICLGQSTNLQAGAIGSNINYQWQVSTNGGISYSNIVNGGVYSGATTFNLSLTTPPASYNNYKYKCVVSGSCPTTKTTTEATLTVNIPVSINTQPPSALTLCSGDNTTLTVAATGTGLTYRWYIFNGSTYTALNNGGIYSGVTNASLNITGITAAPNVQTYTYRCIATGSCNAVTSNATYITVNAKPAVTVNPVSITRCDSTNNTTFSVAATGTNLSYQWQISTNNGATWTNLSNNSTYQATTTQTILLPRVYYSMNGYQFRCVVSGTCAPPANSAAAILTVNPLVRPVVTITATNTDICIGQSVTFNATHINGGNTPQYQWRKGNVTVATGSSYTTTTLANNDVITCHMTSVANCPSPVVVVSNPITMKVTPYSTATINITSNVGNSWCTGKPIVFRATIANGGQAPSFQWFVNNVPTGINADSLPLPFINHGDIVKCELTSSLKCFVPDPAVSNSIIMTVIQTTVSSIVIAPNPDSVICDKTEVTMYAFFTNGGATPRFQWMLNGVDMVGETGGTLKTTLLANGDIVNCRLNSSATCVFPEISNPVSFNVGALLNPKVTVFASYNGGNSYTFTAVPVLGGTNPHYQWYVNSKRMAGENGVTFTVNNLGKTDRVWVEMASNEPCVNPMMNLVTSEIITTGLGNVELGFKELGLYPNPNTGQFTISGELSQPVAKKVVILKITNALGQTIYVKAYQANGNTINIPVILRETVANGMYNANITIDDKTTHVRFVLSR